jgi:hypothetical protein
VDLRSELLVTPFDFGTTVAANDISGLLITFLFRLVVIVGAANLLTAPEILTLP